MDNVRNIKEVLQARAASEIKKTSKNSRRAKSNSSTKANKSESQDLRTTLKKSLQGIDVDTPKGRNQAREILFATILSSKLKFNNAETSTLVRVTKEVDKTIELDEALSQRVNQLIEELLQ